MEAIRFEGDHDVVRTGVRKVLLKFQDHRKLTWRLGFGADMCMERGVEWTMDRAW